jgi:secernin
MCDTFVALGNATIDGAVILAKNSDREPNEAQTLTYIPRARHAPGAMVKCTYVEISQAAETYAALLSRPFWIWGAEMGVNERGVAIGNEAVFTRAPYRKEPGLIGMDFVRLALERGASAREALDVIVALLEEHGQGGDCGFDHQMFYHNSFLIADPDEAWLLETVERQWAAERVRDVRVISNRLTIGRTWDLASPDLAARAIEAGWCKSKADFHMARCYSDLWMTRFGGSQARQCRAMQILRAQKGAISVETMMAALRDHGPREGTEETGDPTPTLWRDPGRGWLTDKLCVHAGFGPTRPAQTTGSMVAHLAPGLTTVWLTGTAAPCTGVFKPVYLMGGLPDVGPEPTGVYDAESLWWAHERLHRAVIRRYKARLSAYAAERDALEAEFLAEASALAREVGRLSADELSERQASLTASCFARAAEAAEAWRERVLAIPVGRPLPRLFDLAWNRFNQRAKFDGELIRMGDE